MNKFYQQPEWIIGAKIGSIGGTFVGAFIGTGFIWSIWRTWDNFSLSMLVFLVRSIIFLISFYILAGISLGGLVGLIRSKLRFRPWMSMLIAGSLGGIVWSLIIVALICVWNRQEPLSEILQLLIVGMIIGLLIAFFLERRIQHLKNKDSW